MIGAFAAFLFALRTDLPTRLQKKAIVWGTVGAIVVRSAMTVGVVWLLKIPGLMLVGGLGLLWVAYESCWRHPAIRSSPRWRTALCAS